MLIRLTARAVIAVLLTLLVTGSAISQTQSADDLRRIEKVKARVIEIGSGRRIEIKLDNGTLKGVIGVIGDDQFGLIDSQRGTVTPISYNKVKSLKRVGQHSSLLPLAFGAAVIGGVVLVTALLLRGS